MYTILHLDTAGVEASKWVKTRIRELSQRKLSAVILTSLTTFANFLTALALRGECNQFLAALQE